ncbi:MAG: tetratricopeptide repeat protein [Planctomycetes bacterium]|nr:tetratricopeptide repeat protein [Planctomycetota bacterium]
MRWFRMITTLLVLFAAKPVHAQVFIGPTGFGYFSGGGVSFNYRSRHLHFSAFSGSGFYYRQSYFNSYAFGGFYPPLYPGPWFGPPIFYPPPPPIVFVPQPILIPQPIIIQARAEEAVEEPRVDPERFLVIRPNQPPNPPARVERKPKEVDLGIKPADFPLARGPAKNPVIEADRRIELGRGAFAKGEYGPALEHFRFATIVQPEESAAYFLLAEAQFAIGKYDDAVASILKGLKRRPDWPRAKFRPRDLYDQNPAAFDAHIGNLRAALARDADDYRLLFLLGVQLWFDGRRAEAEPLIQNAAKRAKDPAPIEAFVRK